MLRLFEKFPAIGGVVMLPALLLAACLSIPDSVEGADTWPVEILAPDPLGHVSNVKVGRRAADDGYWLHFRTSIAGLAVTNTEALVESLSKQPGGKSTDGVGHSWILLEGPDDRIECGHSGEYGKERPTYHQGVMNLMKAGDPNPARYLWEEMHDGIRLEGSGGRDRTYTCRIPITRREHEAIRSFIDSFDFSVFALRGKGCSDFVVRIAHLAGITLPHRVRVRLPPRIRVTGTSRTLWIDPEFGSIVFGSPEVLESGLRELVETGAAIE